MPLILDPQGRGLAKVLRDYQIEALRFVWKEGGEGVNSREVWKHANDALRGVRTISRASIINFLNSMVEEGILRYEEETCKGGMRRVYFPKLDERGFKKHVAKTVIRSLLDDFPEETKEILKELI